jgi:signal transduction histidine kinase
MKPLRWRIRFLLLAATAGTSLLAFAVLERTGSRFLRNRLSPELDPVRVEDVLSDYRGVVVAVAIAAGVAGALFALALGHAFAGAIATMRAETIARTRTGTTLLSRPSVLELQALANAIDLLATDLDRRNQSLVRERDDLALLVASVSEGMVQIGADGRIAHANPAAHTLLGLPRGVVGQPVASVVRHAELRSFLERAAVGGAIASCEVTLDDRRVLVAARPIAGESAARPLGTVVAFTDLTELRRLEGVRRDFVANVSHELKTPLTSIRGYAETLLADDLPPDVRRQFLDVIQKNAERLHYIVDDLLDLSRLESGGWRPELQRIRAREIAEDVWAGVRERARAKRIDFVPEGDDVPIIADPSGVRQVISNLFDNAIRHTPDGGRITVRIQPAPPPASPDDRPARAQPAAQPHDAPRANGAPAPLRLVTIEVQDTGSGIPHDALPRVFERFYRADPARSRAEGGTGLGLSIVKHLVESMGGDVTAYSVFGKGTTIRFRLPAA